ncbi:MAG TPA: mercury resistance system periplasmic binding protein MerP [Acidobacteriaceae bacterium]|nr:mercury resistance system periplasmic binding protein MerP [Acidobacteriaceae bacterium]
MKRTVIAAIAAALCVTPLWAATQTAILKVSGMTCSACPITVKKALQGVPGVSKIDVNYPQKEVMVTFDDAKTNESALMKATSDVGFPSQLVKPRQ